LFSLSTELKGLALSTLVALVLGFLATVLVYFTPLQETLLDSLARLIMILAVFTGGSYVARTRGRQGLIGGVTLGILFFILMLILSLIFNPALISFKTFIQQFLICIIAGALGGVLGIGLAYQD
jgi:putative membrane protein (TIGR04086 family)